MPDDVSVEPSDEDRRWPRTTGCAAARVLLRVTAAWADRRRHWRVIARELHTLHLAETRAARARHNRRDASSRENRVHRVGWP